jgi:tRNA nucleotidyltransferase (CCA-adding enzyme)
MDIADTHNLSDQVHDRLPGELANFLQVAGQEAAAMGHQIYLVGGVVRDLLLGRTNLDLDLVVEGDAIKLAQKLSSLLGGSVVVHRRFNTAKVRWGGWMADLAGARSETYAVPGALPAVKQSDIKKDLSRRDFTINSMAIRLEPSRYGELIDLYDGRVDLERKYIRVLHARSFIDDASRIWRAVRYEQRLDFSVEPDTLKLLVDAIPLLETISGDRIRHELELALEESLPEKVILRARGLGALNKIDSSLEVGDWLAGKYHKAREYTKPESPSVGLYLALLVYPVSTEQLNKIIAFLKLPGTLVRVVQDTLLLKAAQAEMYRPGLAPSRIYELVKGYIHTALIANLIATDSPEVERYISVYLRNLNCIQPILAGEDLLRLGIQPGPRVGEILQVLREARMDGWITTRQDEVNLVKKASRQVDLNQD